MSAEQSNAEFFGGVPGFPISLAVRAGDYAYTATLGAHTPSFCGTRRVFYFALPSGSDVPPS